jgi:phage shock protein PspC (stress-responsive transcriptional regulator)
MEPTTHLTDTEPRPLRRSLQGRLIAGVAGGLADHFDVDVAVVRIVLVALGLTGGLGIPLYVAGWLLVPEEGSDHAVADELLANLHRA